MVITINEHFNKFWIQAKVSRIGKEWIETTADVKFLHLEDFLNNESILKNQSAKTEDTEKPNPGRTKKNEIF
jgi:hypothetical protein